MNIPGKYGDAFVGASTICLQQAKVFFSPSWLCYVASVAHAVDHIRHIDSVCRLSINP